MAMRPLPHGIEAVLAGSFRTWRPRTVAVSSGLCPGLLTKTRTNEADTEADEQNKAIESHPASLWIQQFASTIWVLA